MRPALHRIGNEQAPVVVIDGFSGRLDEILNLADALAPYPEIAGSYYPGVRRVITAADRANDYVEKSCGEAGQFIAGAFDIDKFKLLEASFSIVTTDPADLSSPQRAPHFDSPDPKHFAMLHYLRVPTGSGTAFYRQRATGIERVTERNIAQFVTAAECDAAQLKAGSGYINSSDRFFEQIAAFEAIPDRLLIYQGGLLHSGIIPAGMNFSADPQRGRLTANFFLLGR